MLSHGKHVLLEKPVTMDALQLLELQKLASSRNLFFQTNFWTRQFPAVKYMREVVESGRIGDVVTMTGDFGFYGAQVERLRNKTLGGGGLMDVGCYLIQYATMLKGGQSPSKITSLAKLNEQGVDLDINMVLKWEDSFATFTVGIDRFDGGNFAVIGSKGRVDIEEHVNNPEKLTVTAWSNIDGATKPVSSWADWTYYQPIPSVPAEYAPLNYPQSTGFTYTVEAVEKALKSGKTFLQEATPDEQLILMQISDTIRHQIGVFWDYESSQMSVKS